ncbi:hypothetical protein D3273_16890 [Lichenibacterium minor]|uniref:Uncharacterized protein n=1 Tax=Lichenibacterium minor TaxID=2316528 RepID=A0A4Q2U3F5_9HYPH|nr:hypothetical protein [Lichenibacterium minor]RYC30862.1 hypothetical protein D3273_16890 [Lichenibacterium minor]
MANELKSPKMTPEQQRAAFEATARELGCDESPDAFEAAVKKVAKAPPTKGTDLKALKRK